MDKQNPIIIFDGVCNFCNNSVQFILKADRKKIFRFTAFQSGAGKKLIQTFNIPPNFDSVILIYQNKAHLKSDAAIEIGKLLPFPWRILSSIKFIPKKWRDFLYDLIAKNRYSWFGKRDSCKVATEKEKPIFIESLADLERYYSKA